MVRARSGGTQRLVIGWLCRPTGFRFAISTHLVLVDQLMFSVPNASAPLATRVFTQGPGPRQHRRRAQPASRESRLALVVGEGDIPCQERGQGVGGVVVKGMSCSVVAAGGAWVGVAGGVLDVAQGDPS